MSVSSSHDRGRLTTRIVSPQDQSLSTEDIFSAALETLFTDDTQQSHGVPGESVIYRSPRFGDVFLRIPAHPDDEAGRLLFAHYLWNAGVIAAEAIERASCDGDDGVGARDAVGDDDDVLVRWDRRFWDMRGLDVLELGAATALPSLMAALSNARSVTSTDHPSSPAITTNAIESNFKVNVLERRSGRSARDHDATNGGHDGAVDDAEQTYTNTTVPTLHQPPVDTDTKVSVRGYAWGTTTFYDPHSFGDPAVPQPGLHSFDRVIVADCLWMQAQHENLVRTILAYLRRGSSPCALVVAGFHTGRAVVGDFIVVATGDLMGTGDAAVQSTRQQESNGGEGTEDLGDDVKGRLKAVEIFEVDVDGRRRDWAPVRPDETKEQSKRWCVCAVLAQR